MRHLRRCVALAVVRCASALSRTELIETFGLREGVATTQSTWRSESASCVSFAVAGDGDDSGDSGDGGGGGDDASRFETTSVAVVDGLVDGALRSELLALLGESDARVECGPSPESWTGTFVDHEDESGRADRGGLAPSLLSTLGGAPPPRALVELQTRLRKWFVTCNGDDGLVVSRMPRLAVGSADVPQIAANAPVSGDGDDAYGWHVDADPAVVPPSPWKDAFGAYANRSPGRPRWVTALVYLSPEWKAEWRASTRFLDVKARAILDVFPAPGRVVLLDQDLVHSVSSPAPSAEKRARFSLVLKLVIHPSPGSGARISIAPRGSGSDSESPPGRDPVPGVGAFRAIARGDVA